MDLREKYQWASPRMTPFDWICATHLFNTELESLNRRDLRSTRTIKVPRALMDALGDVERTILVRILEQNFKC